MTDQLIKQQNVLPVGNAFNDLWPLISKRLCLRLLRERDLNAFVKHRSDPRVCRYIAPTMDRDGVERLFQESGVWTGSEGHLLAIAITSRVSGEVMGEGALRIESLADRRVEIGCMLHFDYHGFGYGSEVARVLMDFCFQKLGAHKVVAYCDTDNVASIRVLENLGMVREAHFRDQVRREWGWTDTYVYSSIPSRDL